MLTKETREVDASLVEKPKTIPNHPIMTSSPLETVFDHENMSFVVQYIDCHCPFCNRHVKFSIAKENTDWQTVVEEQKEIYEKVIEALTKDLAQERSELQMYRVMYERGRRNLI